LVVGAQARTWLERSALSALHFRFTFITPVLSRCLILLRLAGCACVAASGVMRAVDLPGGSLGPLLPVVSQWTVSSTAEASVGFKDNLLLSASAEERSAFLRGSASFLLLRATTGRLEYSLFTQVDATRYFSGEAVKHDVRAWLQTELGYRWGERLKVALPVTAYHSDQVFDVSDTEVERLVAALKVTGASAGPRARWSFRPESWLEVQATGERKNYADGSNNGDVGEGALRLGWKPGSRLEMRLGATRRWRGFDRRATYSASGRELVGTRLRIAEEEWEGRADIGWDGAGRWRSLARAGRMSYRDNASGYFNFHQGRVAHELEWRSGPWLCRLVTEAKRVEFDVQTVGFGLAPPPRIKDEFLGELRVERSLGRRWTVLAGATWERTRSNDTVASYVVNEGLLGLRWSWEK
jgi:hypothetical protein